MTNSKMRLRTLCLAFVLAITAAMPVFAYADEPSIDDNPIVNEEFQGPYGSIFTLKVPGVQNTPGSNVPTICSERDFYVLGTITNGERIPDNFELKINLIRVSPGPETIVQTVVALGKNRDNYMWVRYPALTGVDGVPMGFPGMPDLMSSDPHASASENQPQDFDNPQLKCYYNDRMFSALFLGGVGAGNPNDPNEIDRSNVPDLVPGDYVINGYMDKDVVFSSALKVEDAEKIILSRFGPKEHADNVKKYAKDNEIRILLDPLPGFWSGSNLAALDIHPLQDETNYFSEILPRWRMADSQEYTAATTRPHMFLYNISSSSATYNVESSKMVFDGRTNDLTNKYYALGEPSINGTKSPILTMSPDNMAQLTRLDVPNVGTPVKPNEVKIDNLKFMGSSQIYDECYINVPVGRDIAIYGVSVPLPAVRDVEVTFSDDFKTYTSEKQVNCIRYDIYSTGSDVRLIEQFAFEMSPLNRYYSGATDPSKSMFEFGNVINLKGKYAEGGIYNVIATFYYKKGERVDVFNSQSFNIQTYTY